MDHTYSGQIHTITLNGIEVGEIGINATLAGHWGVPMALITGDDKVALEAQGLRPKSTKDFGTACIVRFSNTVGEF